jgi:hypothetical protein
MAIRNRVLKDMRHNSRVMACLDAEFTHDKLSYPAVVLDLSQKGAQFTSKFLPPKDALIEVTIRSHESKDPVIVDAVVLRKSRIVTDHGPKARFAVRFIQTPLVLIDLLTRLLAK